MRELDASNRILRQVLGSSAGLAALVSTRIWQDVAPQSTVFPYVVFTRIGGSREQWLDDGDGGRALFLPRYQVNAVSMGNDQTSAYNIDNAIDEVLRVTRNSEITLDRTYTNQGFVRIGDVDRSEKDTSGVQYNYIGGEYDMFLSYS